MIRRSLLTLAVLAPLFVLSQRNVRDSVIGTPWVSFQYGANWTGGDLSSRYGFFNHVGFMAGYKTKKNWFYGMESMFMFGQPLGAGSEFDGIFDHLVDQQGNINDVNGDIGLVVLYSRGFFANAIIGKVIPVLSPNENSGIFIHAGGGYLLHKLRVETQDQVIPQLELDYRKGYDRMTIGANLHQFVGYAFMANSGFLNFYGGFYLQEGLTRNVRTINFDSPDTPVSKDLRLDIQYGVKAGWFIPFYKRQPKEFYYN
jgi:hypothetical protein